MNDLKQKIYSEIRESEIKLLELRKLTKVYDSYDVSLNRSLTEQNVISERRNHEVKKKESADFSQNAKDEYIVGQWSYYFHDNILDWSSEVFYIFEYGKEYSGTLYDFYLSNIDSHSKSRIREVIQSLKDEDDERVLSQFITTSLGNEKLLSISFSPILSDKKEVIGVQGSITDLTEEVDGEKVVDTFFKSTMDLHCIANKDKYFIKVSSAWIDLLGYTEEELLSKPYPEFIYFEDIDPTDNLVDGTSILEFENRYVTKSGEIVYLSWFYKWDIETDLIYCSARNITESKKAKAALLNQLSDKEILLREIHHRVKNNLQIIISLLSLQQGENSKEEHLSRLYEDSRNRIQSMAAIHEMFNQSEELDRIEFGHYLNKLLFDLSESFKSENKSVDFSVNVKSVFVNLDTAIPLGLIINEIVTNSIKYGEGRNGKVKIFVELEIMDNDVLTLTIGDHGVNSIGNILNQKVESLGVLLINSLVEQVNGQIEQLENCEGTVFRLKLTNKTKVDV